MIMFDVIYRGYALKGKEAAYKESWHRIAAFFKRERGALVSALHQAEDVEFTAYSRRPDQAAQKAYMGFLHALSALINLR